jgi:hypothetical protein
MSERDLRRKLHLQASGLCTICGRNRLQGKWKCADCNELGRCSVTFHRPGFRLRCRIVSTLPLSAGYSVCVSVVGGAFATPDRWDTNTRRPGVFRTSPESRLFVAHGTTQD